jgi:hypothetical protein
METREQQISIKRSLNAALKFYFYTSSGTAGAAISPFPELQE